MERELDIPKDRPAILLESTLGNRETLHHLLSLRSSAKEKVLDEASKEIEALDHAETGRLVQLIFNGLSREDEEWDVNKRDGALELLWLIDFEKVGRNQLEKDYLNAVATQNSDSDPYGSIHSLLDAGQIISDHLPFGVETEDKLAIAWGKVEKYFRDEDKAYIERKTMAVISGVIRDPEELLGDPDISLGRRNEPRLDPQEKSLHDKYLEETKKRKTFKLALWENTPQFRAVCQSHGIELERFWNINNPDEVVSALNSIPWEKYPQARDSFNKALVEETGVNLTTLSSESSRTLADEIVKAANKARAEIISTVGDFGSVIDRFNKLMEDAREKGSRSQQVLTAQIANFFRENGVMLADRSYDSAIVVLNSTERLKIAEATFVQKQQAKKESATILEDTFRLNERSKDFALIARQREDLFLGDLTGDCTAYHLYVGINAWTVPIWLSNPGFNIYKIMDNDRLVAKLGILLTLAEGNSVLVVDSFEVGQGIRDQQGSIKQIEKGLTYLRKWAESIGFKKVLINTVSNSSGAADLLRNVDITEQSHEPELHILGGLSGVSELRQRLVGEKADERIYLQSQSFDLDEFDEHGEETTEEQAKLTREFEQVIAATINKARPEDRSNIENLARSQNWAELFKFFIDVNYPTISKVVGNSWERYKTFMGVIEIDDMGTPFRIEDRIDADLEYSKDQFPVSRIIEELFIEEAARQNREADDEDYYTNPLVQEADKVDNFLIMLKRMEYEGLSPEMVLMKLYGQTTAEDGVDSEDAIKLSINSRLPRLII